MPLIASFIAEALRHRDDPAKVAAVKAKVADLCAKFPVYPQPF
jgi:glycine/serine hydroxymethyltransferase